MGAGSPMVVFLQQPLSQGGREGFFSLRESWGREVGGPCYVTVTSGSFSLCLLEVRNTVDLGAQAVTQPPVLGLPGGGLEWIWSSPGLQLQPGDH